MNDQDPDIPRSLGPRVRIVFHPEGRQEPICTRHKKDVTMICPACRGERGGKTPSAARLKALAKNRKKRWPKKG
ncbi:MAG TPA: hypothetical protein PLB01_00055 [Thermoanaerobaculia bacterium]|nr:hypothetical protein [Thermoanaerobaculia bacterium]